MTCILIKFLLVVDQKIGISELQCNLVRFRQIPGNHSKYFHGNFRKTRLRHGIIRSEWTYCTGASRFYNKRVAKRDGKGISPWKRRSSEISNNWTEKIFQPHLPWESILSRDSHPDGIAYSLNSSSHSQADIGRRDEPYRRTKNDFDGRVCRVDRSLPSQVDHSI